MKDKITFGADGLRISGPSIDETWKITFTTGGYEKEKIAALFPLVGKNLKVTVEESKDATPPPLPIPEIPIT